MKNLLRTTIACSTIAISMSACRDNDKAKENSEVKKDPAVEARLKDLDAKIDSELDELQKFGCRVSKRPVSVACPEDDKISRASSVAEVVQIVKLSGIKNKIMEIFKERREILSSPAYNGSRTWAENGRRNLFPGSRMPERGQRFYIRSETFSAQ